MSVDDVSVCAAYELCSFLITHYLYKFLVFKCEEVRKEKDGIC
jgi:hypothetical protein